MEQVVLVIHLMLALAIIGLVLLQRSEGGGLGIGGGGMGNLATPGGAASTMTKITSFFAFCFFATSLILGILAGKHTSSSSILDELDNPSVEAAIANEQEKSESIADEEPVPVPSVPLE